MRQAEPADEASTLDLAMSGPANRGKRKAPGVAKALGGAVPEASRLDFDPDALVQTGPGLPTWQWDSVTLDWKGPVAVGQGLRLYLLPPWAVAGLHGRGDGGELPGEVPQHPDQGIGAGRGPRQGKGAARAGEMLGQRGQGDRRK